MTTPETVQVDEHPSDTVLTPYTDEKNANTLSLPTTANTAPLPPTKDRTTRLLQHLGATVRPNAFAELELLILTFVTGIQDATTFPDYHCFASNQTGNTVMLALSIVMPKETEGLFVPANIGVSLAFFLLGAWLTGQLGNHLFGRLSRPFILVSNFMQTLMVFATAAIQFTYGVHLKDKMTLVLIALLAFASGSQVVMSRSLRMTEISTAMATAAWVDLVIDSELLRAHNRARNRRVLFLLTLIAGAFAGAGIYVKMGSAFALLISGLGKSVVMVMFLFNKAMKKEVELADNRV